MCINSRIQVHNDKKIYMNKLLSKEKKQAVKVGLKLRKIFDRRRLVHSKVSPVSINLDYLDNFHLMNSFKLWMTRPLVLR